MELDMDRLYLSNTYLYQAEASILIHKEMPPDDPLAKHGSHALLLDRTIFHPQGGGQPSDVGCIIGQDFRFAVKHAREQEGKLLHIGNFVQGQPAKMEGLAVKLQIDEQNRKMAARLHSGGHLIDVAMRRLEGAKLIPTKGYHFNDGPNVEYRGELSEKIDFLVQKGNEILAQLVKQDIPTKVERLSKEEVTKCGCDVTNYPQEMIRTVFVGGMACPCGGTHVKSTKELAGLRMTKIKKKKDNVKVSYIVG